MSLADLVGQWGILGREVGEHSGQSWVLADIPPSHLDRIPLRKFTSIRRTMTEAGGSVEDLILKDPITKYSMESSTRTNEPVSELLKNYLDVSGVVFWGLALRGECGRG